MMHEVLKYIKKHVYPFIFKPEKKSCTLTDNYIGFLKSICNQVIKILNPWKFIT